ncbi:uncharacterized protein BCR38DRAFT_303745, partial [Pseudomassariella vexata]
SQDTNATNGLDRVFTPPASDSGSSAAHASGTGNGSSQESQLLQLSQIAAAQQKMTDSTGPSRKRMADGMVKHARNSSSISPVRMPGHSRNTSTVSVTSTTGSRIGELSAELKTKLSYAMVKVNHGWQGHSIDEVESLASQAASPTSSTSTLHGRHGASASPSMPMTGALQGTASAGVSPITQQPPQGRTYESFWREGNGGVPHKPASPPASHVPTLAPPAAIQPRQQGQLNARRNSNPRYAPVYLSNSPHTPAQPSPLQSTPGTRTARTPNMDPILFSPHQNVREQEALETLMFMSSPNNSGNLKHSFPSSQPRNGISSQRTALPTSRLNPSTEGRKALPAGRGQTQASHSKRVGFEKSPSTMGDTEVDDPYASPQTRGTPRRRTNGSGPRPPLSMPAGLSGMSRRRSTLRDDDIDRMLDRVAADDSSDSEGEITLPRDRRREG